MTEEQLQIAERMQQQIDTAEERMVSLGLVPATKLPPQRNPDAPPLKTLIAVAGCHARRYTRADNQRETWVKDVCGADVKFFVGRPMDNRTSLPDEVWLDVPDDWQSRKLKVLGMVRWALDHGYQYLWKIDDDVYLRPERLLSLEPFDYCGRVSPVRYINDDTNQEEAFQTAMGAFVGLSRRSMVCLLERDVRPDFLQEDGWVTRQLESFNITPFDLMNWTGFPLWHGAKPIPYNFPKFSPHPSNTVLASFEYIYSHQMREIHSGFQP